MVKMPKASSKFQSFNLQFHHHLFIAAIVFNFFVVYASSDLSVQHELEGGVGLRSLKSFKEKKTGTNITFDCSPSGPCVPCEYSEKKDDRYRCSETGYRIPMKCMNPENPVDEENDKRRRQKGRNNLENTNEKLKVHVLVHDAEDPTASIRHRNLLEKSSSGEDDESGVYITYRSCIPAINEEKLSVLGFEAIILLLLASSLFVIFRRKGTLVMPGAVRVPTNLRF